MDGFEMKFRELSAIKDEWELREESRQLVKSVSDWIQRNLDDQDCVRMGKEYILYFKSRFNKRVLTNLTLKKRNVPADSKKLNNSLNQALEILNNECSRSVEATRALLTSNETLKKSRNSLSTFSNVLKSSSRIVNNLQQKDWIERVLLLFGLLIFFSTVFYILSKRI
jgi:hypothetical protein